MAEFENRVVAVTGAEGGIGSEIAAQFAAAGAHVIVTGIRADQGHALALRLGPQSQFIKLDVSQDADWRRMMAAVLATHGQIDVLVNNAGYLKAGLDLENTSLDEWRAHFAVNADGMFLGCQHAIKAMKDKGGGAIVNVSSAIAARLHADSPAYGVSKSAVLALTRVAALHCGHRRYGIRVNAVLPGPIDTHMMRSNVASAADFAELSSMLIQKYGLARIGSPKDIAAAVLYLASPKSEYVNGAMLAVDGGQSA